MEFVEHIVENIYHHLGLTLITLAFLSLGWKMLKGRKNLVPKDFAALYGVGGIILAYHMYGAAKPFVVAMEVVGAFVALSLAVL
jgi:hypothetical protein